MSGIYIHVPFCYQRCHYCNFYSTVRLSDRNAFIAALIREIAGRKGFLKNEKLNTIYFGGGTPSVLDSDSIAHIFDKIAADYFIEENAEITLEANPDDLNKKYLTDLRDIGVNRLSVGIQSFIDTDLRKLNRRHNSKQAIEAVQLAHECGFTRISIDLMYGLPEQTEELWETNLKIAASLPVDHISAYHLIYEKGTKFYKWLNEGVLSEAEENLSLEFFNKTIEVLEREGFEHYEIASFARNKQYSRHNTKYWFGEKYLGLGPSAHSYNGQIRQWNVDDIDEWMKQDYDSNMVLRSEDIDLSTKRNEMIMTRLRTMWGIPEAEYTREFGYESWENLLKRASPFIDKKLLALTDNVLCITREGKFLSDGIIADLFIVL